MRKFLFTAALTLTTGIFANAAVVAPASDPIAKVCSTISPKELSEMTSRDFEKLVGRTLTKEEKSNFKAEKQAAKKKMKRGFFGEGFPWRSVIIGVLLITVTLILVL